jgi:hypothetical protein
MPPISRVHVVVAGEGRCVWVSIIMGLRRRVRWLGCEVLLAVVGGAVVPVVGWVATPGTAGLATHHRLALLEGGQAATV